MTILFVCKAAPNLFGKGGQYNNTQFVEFFDELSGKIVAAIGVHNGDLVTLCTHADIVVCCYPAAMKRMHPNLPIVGDWEGETLLQWSNQSFIRVGPKD